VNLYRYVGNGVLIWTDPLGLSKHGGRGNHHRQIVVPPRNDYRPRTPALPYTPPRGGERPSGRELVDRAADNPRRNIIQPAVDLLDTIASGDLYAVQFARAASLCRSSPTLEEGCAACCTVTFNGRSLVANGPSWVMGPCNTQLLNPGTVLFQFTVTRK
jgi:hypothetical protein